MFGTGIRGLAGLAIFIAIAVGVALAADVPKDKKTEAPAWKPTKAKDIMPPLSTRPTDTHLAFPTAEGYGRFARGGRSGDVYHVTNLNDDGPGSLRAGVTGLKGPRTIVFDVSGTIHLLKNLMIENVQCLTIAGQTAPGDGIALADQTIKLRHSEDIVIRYIRVRLGSVSNTSNDCMEVVNCRNVIFDHVTDTWGVDGAMDTAFLGNFTLQWSMYGESLHQATHTKGGHAMLMSFRKTTGNITIHHNLLFSSRNRHPTLGGGPALPNPRAIFDVRNNVIYNWEGETNLAAGQFNLVSNYYRPGPNTDPNRRPIAPKVAEDDITVGYFSGNFFEGLNPEWNKDNYAAMSWGVRGGDYKGNVTRAKFVQPDEVVAPADRPVMQTAQEAYKLVLDYAGSSLHRDAADKRIVHGVRDRTHRRIDDQSQVGGWPQLKSLPVPKDTDQDGMPDAWEKAHGLAPNNPADRDGDFNGDGYTNLEKYLNSLCPTPYSTQGHGPRA